MPPKAAKRGLSTTAAKRGGRSTRATTRGKINQTETVEEVNKFEDENLKDEGGVELAVDQEKVVEKAIVKDVEEEKVVERSPMIVEEVNLLAVNRQIRVEEESEIQKVVKNDLQIENEAEKCVSKAVEEDVKESSHEDKKDERLDLEDNDEEYEPEEYCDEKESQQEEYQGEGDERTGGIEENNAGEEEMDDMDEEIEEVVEYEGEEDNEPMDVADAEEEGHQEALKERRKRKEFEVFVGGLDKDATEEDLKVFGKVGEVSEVRLVINPQTKKNKGFAFLRFATAEQAKRAVTELRNPTVCGKTCGVSPSQDSDTLFLGNICKTWTKEHLKGKLKAYGIKNTEDLTLVEADDDEGMNRGFAFLEFSSRAEAKEAFKRLQKRDVTFGIDKPPKISFADSFIDPGDEIMAKVRTVFIDGLLSSWDEDQVRDLLEIYGKIEKIELARNMPSAKRKDFGFVTFDNHDIAVTCAKSINNTDLGSGEKKANVRARLSRPLQKSRGRHSKHIDSSRRLPIRSERGPPRHPALRTPPHRRLRRMDGRDSPPSKRRPVGIRESRQDLAPPPRARPVYSPPRSYDKRPPVPLYPKRSSRDYSRRIELPPRSRYAADYEHRVVLDSRSQNYRDEYSPRVSGYPDVSRAPPYSPVRRSYADDGYAQSFERPHGYREGQPREYDSVSGFKRSYSALDEPPPHYADDSVRHSRPRLDYEMGVSQYEDAYSDRPIRTSIGYSSSSSVPSSHDSRGQYSSRQGSFGNSDVGGVYSSSVYTSDYTSRRPDVSNRSYSSLYSTRGAGSSSYNDSRSSRSYY